MRPRLRAPRSRRWSPWSGRAAPSRRPVSAQVPPLAAGGGARRRVRSQPQPTASTPPSSRGWRQKTRRLDVAIGQGARTSSSGPPSRAASPPQRAPKPAEPPLRPRVGALSGNAGFVAVQRRGGERQRAKDSQTPTRAPVELAVRTITAYYPRLPRKRLPREPGAMYTDLHCHLLWGIDDGPEDPAATLSMEIGRA